MPVLDPLQIAREAVGAHYDAQGCPSTGAMYRRGGHDEGTPLLIAKRAAELALERAAAFVEQWNGATRDGDTVHIAAALRDPEFRKALFGPSGDPSHPPAIRDIAVGAGAQAAAIAAGHAETIADAE